MDVIDQAMAIYAANQGHLDDVPRDQVAAWEKAFLTFMRDQKSEVRQKIADSKDLDDASMPALNAAIADFKPQFSAGKKTARA